MRTISIACDHFGDDVIADMIEIMKAANEAGLTRGNDGHSDCDPIFVITAGRNTLRAGSESDVSKFLLENALGAPAAFQPDDAIEGGIDAVLNLAGRGLGWMTTMLRVLILGHGRELAEAEGASAQCVCSIVGSCYAPRDVVAEYVIKGMAAYADGGNPVAYADALAEGMLRLYALAEPAGVASGIFPSPSLYNRWRRLVDDGAIRTPACVSTLSGVLGLFRDVPSHRSCPDGNLDGSVTLIGDIPSHKPYPSGFGERLVGALESDGTRDYLPLIDWLGSLIRPIGVVSMYEPSMIGWTLRVDKLFRAAKSDMGPALLFSCDDPAVMLATLDFVDVVASVCSSFRTGDYVMNLTTDLWPQCLLKALDILGDGLPTDIAAERLPTIVNGRNRV